MYLWIVMGALGLWLGMPNAVLHLPLAALAYPAALFLIGRAVAEESATAGGSAASSLAGGAGQGGRWGRFFPLGRAFRYGWLCGVLGASACLYWIAIPVHDIGGLPWPLAAPCAVALGAYIALYGGLFAALSAWLASPPLGGQGGLSGQGASKICSPWRRALLLGLAWYLMEWFRGWFCTGFPWLSLASAFAPWPVMVQGASVVGAYGLGGVLVYLVCLGLEDALSGELFRQETPKPRDALYGEEEVTATKSRPMGVAAAGFAVLLCFGFWRLLTLIDAAGPLAEQVGGEPARPEQVRIALIQGNVDQNVKWEPGMQQETLERYLGLSEAALQEKRPSLLIWPETSMPFDYRDVRRTNFPEQIRAFAARQNVGILFGAPGFRRLDPVSAAARGSSYETFNRAHLLTGEGLDAGWYEKEHLVPFGEYMPPWLDLPFLRPLLQGIGDFSPGERHLPLNALLGKAENAGAAARSASLAGGKSLEASLVLGVLICYETIFPELARQRVADGATVLVNISNDAWFGRSAAPSQHLDLGLLRAVEQGRWLVRATNTGISAFVDPAGRIVARGGLFIPESVSHEIVPLSGRTAFFHLAPWLPAAALLLFLFALFPVWRARRSQA